MKSYSKGFAGSLVLYKIKSVQSPSICSYPKEPEYLGVNILYDKHLRDKVHESIYVQI